MSSRPQPDLFKIQQQIKHNSMGIQDYMSDLSDWQKDIKVKEEKIVGGTTTQNKTPVSSSTSSSKQANQKAVPLPPVRNRVDISQQLKEGKQLQGNQKDIFSKNDAENGGADDGKKLKRDVTPMPDYYKNWDKFNVEDALHSDDEEEIMRDRQQQLDDYIQKQQRPKTQDEMLKMTSGARPNTKMVVRGGTIKPVQEAEILKQQGNSYFVSLEFTNAIDCYTRCLAKIPENDTEMKKIVLSNRAQSYLKTNKHKEAEQDADQALKIDPKHLKSLQRRGTARYYLGKLREAKRDLLSSLQIEANSVVAGYLKKTNEKLEKIKFEAYEKMKRRCMFMDMEGGEMERGELIKVSVVDINKSQDAANVNERPGVGKKTANGSDVKTDQGVNGGSKINDGQEDKKKKKKKSNRKKKSVADFMEDEEESKAFELEQQNDQQSNPTSILKSTDSKRDQQEDSISDQPESLEPSKKKKKSVGFDMNQNTVKEFKKDSKIQETSIDDSDQDKSKQQANLDDQIGREISKKKAVASSSTKKPIDLQKISDLQRSEAVAKALKDSLEIPTTASQFERDYKSLQKNKNIEAKLSYLRKIQPENLKKIFRSSLETDLLIDIIKVFSSDQQFIGDQSQYVSQFLSGLSESEAFEMAVEFLMDSEKKGNTTFKFLFHKIIEIRSLFDMLDTKIDGAKLSQLKNKFKI